MIATVHNSNGKMASGVSWKSKFESKILVLAVKFAVNLSKEWEYGSYRTQKRTTKWREDWLGEITKTREVDRDFKRQVCLHAKKTFILKISKNVSKIKQILINYIENLR